MMNRVSRIAALAGLLALPLGAFLAGSLVVGSPSPPDTPAVVRIGESSPTPDGPLTTTTTVTPPPAPEPAPSYIPPPPPAADDDWDDDDGDDDDG